MIHAHARLHKNPRRTKYGLIKKHLVQHQTQVDQFFISLSVQNFSSEAAETLRARLIKYQNKLFTFVNYDGVPWNNNNAEHAIKQFAYYRENNIGILKEAGLSEYLILLSICQTCQYKGVSFLNFLLSKEQNIDIFFQRKKQRRKLSDIELYPDGFVPSHFTNKFGSSRVLVEPLKPGGDSKSNPLIHR